MNVAMSEQNINGFTVYDRLSIDVTSYNNRLWNKKSFCDKCKHVLKIIFSFGMYYKYYVNQLKNRITQKSEQLNFKEKQELNIEQQEVQINGKNFKIRKGGVICFNENEKYVYVKTSNTKKNSILTHLQSRFPGVRHLSPPPGKQDVGGHVTLAWGKELTEENKERLRQLDGKIVKFDRINFTTVNTCHGLLFKLDIISTDLEKMRENVELPPKLRSRDGQEINFHMTLGAE